jgi:hypothetical protein
MYEYCKVLDKNVRAMEDELRQWKEERTGWVAVGVREPGPWEALVRSEWRKGLARFVSRCGLKRRNCVLLLLLVVSLFVLYSTCL